MSTHLGPRPRLLLLLGAFLLFLFPSRALTHSRAPASAFSPDGETVLQAMPRRDDAVLPAAASPVKPALPASAPSDAHYRSLGMVDIREVDPTVFVDLVYAKDTNILGRPFYHGLNVCYLRREAALRLRDAGLELRRREPGLRLLVYDGLRPLSAQRELWQAVARTPLQRYVADPASGSMHNYGMAVDLTLCDSTGVPVDMGCGYDELGPLAQPRLEDRLLREGKLTSGQVAYRRLLRSVMTRVGFQPLAIEWWHFHLGDAKTVRRTLKPLE